MTSVDTTLNTGSAEMPAAQIIERVGVVGSGTMGLGIVELCALRGLAVTLAVSREASLTSAPQRLAASLDRGVAKQKMTPDRRDMILSRLAVTTDLADLGDRQLIIEAVPEDVHLKLALFASLDKIAADHAIVASTTSSISITRLAAATENPHRVMGIHFFNPAVVLPLVELVPTMLTDDEVTARVTSFVTEMLGKEQISVPDRSGFVVNALLIPYLLAAIRMTETGAGTAELIDRAMELGCAHPMGPLRLSDLIGLDVVVAIARALYDEYKQPLYAPPSLLLRMVESGLLGRKSGRGFYTYA